MLETALKLLKKINSFGFKAYIVGGYPRDIYLKRTSIDIDMCTNATPKDLNNIFKGSILPKQQYGGITVISNKIRFEITTFRKEIKYKNNRFPVKIKYIDNLTEDLERRDFTINTLCIDESGQFIDLLNAKNDLDNKIIKCVGSADKKIKEDILRSLRAIRFATILNFKLDEKLKKAIKKHHKLLKNLSYYRKKEELDKIFSSTNCKYGISLIKELGLAKDLEIGGIENIKITSSALAMWVQLDCNNYNFSNIEKEEINNIKSLLKEDLLDNKVLYKYGLYTATLASEIKSIDRAIIVAKYNNLPITSRKDINIKANEICDILNKKQGPFLKDIYSLLENKILDYEIKNEKEDIIKYLKVNSK